MIERRRRFLAVLIAAFIVVGSSLWASWQNHQAHPAVLPAPTTVAAQNLAINQLVTLAIKGRAPKTGYSREQFSDGWADAGDCDMRNFILKRDLKDAITRSDTDCTVMSGILNDPYTAKTIHFSRGLGSSTAVEIDHVVAVSDAWQKGAQQLSADSRYQFYNDPLNLLAVDGPTNVQKGDGDAATWLPPNKLFRCAYVARQIAVKVKYNLWVTQAEHDAMFRILKTCPAQTVPTEK